MKISIIIPVLHEGEKINEILDSIKSAAAAVPYETIVVDGDSSGGTIAHISDSSVLTLTAPRGRALQMNAGAAKACGDILLFLHADTLLPPKAFPRIITAISNSSFIGGAFDLKIQNRRWIFKAIGQAASWKHRLTRVPYGDQAIFMLRRYFENIGGYAGIPLMEDVELMRRVKRQGKRIIILPEAVTTSARKWETDGVFYTIIRNWIIQALYLFGMPARRLIKYYYK
ncbi:MAG: TIGR04283 family arsenosugar biosynthesis glycosyltransferase [Smithella sp.]|jgi:rSAM/selenodomain-associated transferase 2